MSSSNGHKQYDVILVAGEGKASYKVYHQNKAFLTLQGKCVILYVIEALQQVESIGDIYIVGLKEKLDQTYKNAHVTEYDNGLEILYRVRVGKASSLEQAVEYEKNLIQNGFKDVFIVAE